MSYQRKSTVTVVDTIISNFIEVFNLPEDKVKAMLNATYNIEVQTKDGKVMAEFDGLLMQKSNYLDKGLKSAKVKDVSKKCSHTKQDGNQCKSWASTKDGCNSAFCNNHQPEKLSDKVKALAKQLKEAEQEAMNVETESVASQSPKEKQVVVIDDLEEGEFEE